MDKKDKKIKVLFLDILTDNKYLRKEIEDKIYFGGTYAENMREAFGLAKNQMITKDGSKGKLPDPTKYSAIVMGGSVKDPINGQQKPWMERVYQFIRLVKKRGVPLLGICGGLQFTVKALGGKVIFNPKGRNFGNSLVKLSKDGENDFLFKDLPPEIVVQSSHKCISQGLGKGWKLLGSSEKSPFDAIAIGDKIRLLQFHPEMIVKNARALAKMRRRFFIEEKFVSAKDFPRMVKSLKDTSVIGKKILNNFLKYYVYND